MKRQIAAALITLNFCATPVLSQEASGHMNCTVLSMHATEAEEGRAQFYSGVENRIEEGDELRFEFNVGREVTDVEFRDTKRDTVIYSTLVPRGATEGELIKDGEASVTGIGNFIRLSAENISSSNSVTGFFRLERYNKSDWHGIVTTAPIIYDPVVQVLVVDCRTPGGFADALDQAIKQVRVGIDH